MSSNIAYRYPPKSGNYFGSHFIMGGEKFDTPQPEAYLFGENGDLNFLGNKPTPFPYPPPQSNEPYKTLKALINIRKESLRFVKVNDESQRQVYNIEFIFDCDVPCSITVHFFVTEDIMGNTISYIPKKSNPCPVVKTFHYKKGASQLFCQPGVTFIPSQYEDDELMYNIDKEIIPIAIQCVTTSDDGQEDQKQCHTTIAVVDHHADDSYTLKGLKQKLYVDGLCYLLQEIYGIENKNNEQYKGCEDCEDGGSECVICMCDIRDTLILPCRHLCLCHSCADSLRYQANNCPICRAPFRALLQIRALQKNSSHVSETSSDNIPPGYDAVSLIEALNGPCAVRHPPLVVSLDPLAECATTAALNRRASAERSGKGSKVSAPSVTSQTQEGEEKSVSDANVPEVRMSTLLASQEHDTSTDPPTPSTSPPLGGKKPPMGTKKPPLIRDKSVLRSTRIPTPDDDSEAEKLSPLLDAATSTQLDRSNSVTDTDTEYYKPTSAGAEYYGTKPSSATAEYYGTKPTSATAEYYGTKPNSAGAEGFRTKPTAAERTKPSASADTHRTKLTTGSAAAETFRAKPTSATVEYYGTKQKAQRLDKSPSLPMSEEMGEYYGGDIELQVEIIGSPSSDQITTITQAGCGGSTVDTAMSSTTPGTSSMIGEESDYYTPEDPSTTILSPVQEFPESQKQPKRTTPASEDSGNGTPTLKSNNWNSSLPGTPLSTASHRSSGDSYSSSSSTRLLLTYENSTAT
ncbi:hypothetical protein M8J76_006490 [Diaphorina citri]|nr:hypothetical protein M8J76_006490 [Diaphorina citri]